MSTIAIELSTLPTITARSSQELHLQNPKDAVSLDIPFTTGDPTPATSTSQIISHQINDDDDDTSPFIPALPPADGGRMAWSFLAAATMIEVMVWGLPFSVGILHVYWTNTLFPGGEGNQAITLAATLQTGLMYMSAGILGPLYAAVPRYQRHIQIIGLVVSAVSLIGTAFVTKPWHLIVSFGVLYPFAGALYIPCAILFYEWFHAKRGLATGIMYAGTGAGGTIFPFIMSSMIDHLGYKPALIGLGIGYAIIGGGCLMFIKRRVPLLRAEQAGTEVLGEESRRRNSRTDWSFMKRKTMIFGMLTILVTSLGNFVPSLWLPSFADDLHMTNPSGVGLLALMNAASVPGNALLGYLSDKWPIHHVITLSCLGSGLSCLFLWGFGTSTALLIVFVLVFGLLGLSFSGAWSKMISVIAKDDATAAVMSFSAFAFIRGVGNITSGPIADALLKVDILRGSAGAFGYKNYGILLIYTGVSIVGGCLTGLAFMEPKQIAP